MAFRSEELSMYIGVRATVLDIILRVSWPNWSPGYAAIKGMPNSEARFVLKTVLGKCKSTGLKHQLCLHLHRRKVAGVKFGNLKRSLPLSTWLKQEKMYEYWIFRKNEPSSPTY